MLGRAKTLSTHLKAIPKVLSGRRDGVCLIEAVGIREHRWRCIRSPARHGSPQGNGRRGYRLTVRICDTAANHKSRRKSHFNRSGLILNLRKTRQIVFGIPGQDQDASDA